MIFLLYHSGCLPSNPSLEKCKDRATSGIREIALTLCPTLPEVRDPFWIQAAQNLLTGHLLFSYKRGATFIRTLRVLQSTPVETLLEVDSQDEDARPFLMQCIGLKKETLSSIMVELSNKVMPFATDPDIRDALSKQEVITPKMLEEGQDVFLVIPEYKLEQWKAMITLIVQQFLHYFERRSEGAPIPILFLLDEFPRLGKMDAVVHGLATLRSKKITIMPVVQSLAQLDAIYGHDNRKIIADNCSYKAILNATDADTQKYLSALVGTELREKVTHSSSGTPFTKGYSSGTSTTSEEKAVIRPEEFAYLSDIVLLTPRGFLRVQKVPYYQHEPALVHVERNEAPLHNSPPAAAPPYAQGYQAKPSLSPSAPQSLTHWAKQYFPPSEGTLPVSTSGNGHRPPAVPPPPVEQREPPVQPSAAQGEQGTRPHNGASLSLPQERQLVISV